ncbi:MAG: hypothetical protein P8J50_13210 [Acidimicrobiales bacterium]|nr:hypothetical protein [Acidimicrobiales bacterium]
MRKRLLILLVLVLALIAVACGDDGSGENADVDGSTTTTISGDDGDPDDATTTSTTSSTTTPDEPTTTTTTEAPSGPTGILVREEMTTADGLRVDWQLNAGTDSLCFSARPFHDDPDIGTTLGNGPERCITPGVDDMGGEALSIDVGTVDGSKTVGYVWGRVAPEILVLTIHHADGSATEVPLLDGPTDVQVFAYVVEIATIPAVVEIEAISGERTAGTIPIRGFLRFGPTYPTVDPPPTAPPPDYPES